jgi:hypothetical protein
MVSESEGPARKRLKTALENQTQNSNEQIQVNNQASLAQAGTDPFLDDTDDDDQAEIPTDTVAALNLLKNEFPKIPGVGGCSECSF